MKAKISIPTTLVAKFKRNKESKLAYFEDIYEIDDVPVVSSENKNVYDTGVYGYFVCDENLFFTVGDFFLENETENSISFSVSTIDYGIFLFSHYMPENIFSSFEKIDGVQEIIYDERKDIQEKIKIVEKNMKIIYSGNFVYLCLDTGIKITKNDNVNNIKDLFENLSKGILPYLNSISSYEKEIPFYITKLILSGFILREIPLVLGKNFDNFTDIKKSIEHKAYQMEILELIIKHYGEHPLCNMFTKTSSVLSVLHDLKTDFITEMIEIMQKRVIENETKEKLNFVFEKFNQQKDMSFVGNKL